MEKTVRMTAKEIDDTLRMINIIIKQMNDGELVVDDPKFSYVLGRNLRILKTENTEYLDAQNDAMREFGEYYEDEEQGSGYRINMKNLEQLKAFENKVKEVGNIQHEITVFAVPMSVMEGWKLPFSHSTFLWFLVEDVDF